MAMDSVSSRKGYANPQIDASPDYKYIYITPPSQGYVLLIPEDTSIPKFQFHVFNVEFKPQQASWEYYSTGTGQQAIRKQCDKYAELSFSALVSDDMVDGYIYDGEPRSPDYSNSQFLQYRSNFFSEFRGVRCSVISELFPPFNGVIEQISYEIQEGDTDATYKVEMRQYNASQYDQNFARMSNVDKLTGETSKKSSATATKTSTAQKAATAKTSKTKTKVSTTNNTTKITKTVTSSKSGKNITVNASGATKAAALAEFKKQLKAQGLSTSEINSIIKEAKKAS